MTGTNRGALLITHTAALQTGTEVARTYLDKLFHGGGGPTAAMNIGEWLLALPATLLYGTIAIVSLLWQLATQDAVGALSITALLLFLGAGLWLRLSRPIIVLVLVWFNALLGLPITVSAATDDPVLAWTLAANLPAFALAAWVTFRVARRLRLKP